MKKIIYFFLIFLNVAYSDPRVFKADSDNDFYQDNDVYVFRYTVAFASALHFPKKYIASLSPNLLAIEVRATKNRFLKKQDWVALFPGRVFTDEQQEQVNEVIPALEVIYRHKKKLPVYYHQDCYITLYVPSQLDVNYPEQTQTARVSETDSVVDKALAPIGRMLAAQGRTSTYDALLAVKKNEIKRQYQQPPALPIVGYRRNVFPGVNAIQLGPDVDCEVVRLGKKNKIALMKSDKKGFYVFSLAAVPLTAYLRALT